VAVLKRRNRSGDASYIRNVRHRVCAVTRRRFPVGASPTRQPLQPEATGAGMEASRVETAKSQMAAYDADNSIRRIVYIIVNFDDNRHQYADDYSAQIDSFIIAKSLPQIEIVFHIKRPYYSATV
jgi:hypothetical protein